MKRISLSVAALLIASNGLASVSTSQVDSDDQFNTSEQERAALLEMINTQETVENSKAAEAAVERKPAVLPSVVSDHLEYSAAGATAVEDDVPLTDATAVQLED